MHSITGEFKVGLRRAEELEFQAGTSLGQRGPRAWPRPGVGGGGWGTGPGPLATSFKFQATWNYAWTDQQVCADQPGILGWCQLGNPDWCETSEIYNISISMLLTTFMGIPCRCGGPGDYRVPQRDSY